MTPVALHKTRLFISTDLLAKSGEGSGKKIANQAGFYLLGGRWHKLHHDKPAPKHAPQAAHPQAAGIHTPASHFTDDQWAQLKLPDSNVNAAGFNKKLAELKGYSDSGDVTAILGMGVGSNTYGAKIAKISNTLLGMYGSQHKIEPGQKPGTHSAVLGAPVAPHPSGLPEHLAPKAAAPAPAPAAEPAPAPKADKKQITVPVMTGKTGPNTFNEAPDFADHDAAQEWIAKRSKALGMSKQAFTASYEYAHAMPKMQAAYNVVKQAFDKKQADHGAEVLEQMKVAGVKVGDTVAWTQTGAFMSQNKFEGKVVIKSGVPHVQLAHEVAVAKPGGKLGYTKHLPWQPHMKLKGAAAAPAATDAAPAPAAASSPMDDWKALTSKHWGTIQEFDDISPFLKDPVLAGPAALQAFTSASFMDLNSDSDTPEAKALLAYVAKLPVAKDAKIHRVLGFGSAAAASEFLAALTPAGKPAIQSRTLSSWTTHDPAAPGATPMNNIGLDLASIQGDHRVFMTIDGQKSGKDISFAYSKEGTSKPGLEIVLSKGAQLDVVGVTKKGNDTHLVVSEVQEGDTKPGANGGTLVLKDGHWVLQEKSKPVNYIQPAVAAAPAAGKVPAKPDVSPSVTWQDAVNDIEKAIAAGDVLALEQALSNTQGMFSPGAVKAHAYALAGLAHLGAAESGPKEGDTKPGANGGTLVLKDGHWTLQETAKPVNYIQPADDVSGWTSAMSAGQVPTVKQHAAFLALAQDAQSKILSGFADTPAKFSKVMSLMNQANIAAEAPAAAPAAAAPVSMIPWDKLMLPASNSNAAGNNKKVAAIQALAEAGDVAGLQALKFGSNNYAKKQQLAVASAIEFLTGKTSGAAAMAAVKEHAPAPAKPEVAAPVAAAPAPGAAAPVSMIPWDKLMLPDSNSNAASNNKKVAAIKALADAGDVAGLQAMKFGSNNYGKKQQLAATSAIEFLTGKTSGAAAAAEVKAHAPAPVAPIPSIAPDTPAAQEAVSAKAALVAVGQQKAQAKANAIKAVEAAGFAVSESATKGLLLAGNKGGMATAYASQAQASAAAQKLFDAGIDAGVIGMHPYFVKIYGTIYGAVSGGGAAAPAPVAAPAALKPDVKIGLDMLAAGNQKAALESIAKESSEPPVKAYAAKLLERMAKSAPAQPAPPVLASAKVFHNTSDGHSKFWSVSTHGGMLQTHYGKIGTKGQVTQKAFASPEAAQAEAKKLIGQKQKGDYWFNGMGAHEYAAPAGAAAAPAKAAAPTGPAKPQKPTDLTGFHGVADETAHYLETGNTAKLAEVVANLQGMVSANAMKIKEYATAGIAFLGSAPAQEAPAPSPTALEMNNPPGLDPLVAGWKVAIAAGKAPTKDQAVAMQQFMDNDPGWMEHYQEAVNYSIPGSVYASDDDGVIDDAFDAATSKADKLHLAALAQAGGPKDGDTKQGADGMLVFKDGHWHKVAEAAPAVVKKMKASQISSAIQDVQLGKTKFSNNQAGKTATKAAKAGDATGMHLAHQQALQLGFPNTAAEIVAVAKAMGVTIGAPAPKAPDAPSKWDFETDHPDYPGEKFLIAPAAEEDTHHFVKYQNGQFYVHLFDGEAAGDPFVTTEKLKTADLVAAHLSEIGAPPVSAADLSKLTGAPVSLKPQAPTPAAPAAEYVSPVGTHLAAPAMDAWQKTGEQAGSNPGGRFKDPDGVEWYCKFPSDTNHAHSEVLAAKLYEAAGLAAQDCKLITKGGKVGIASRWVEVKKGGPDELKAISGARSGFVVDAWLANHDVVGTGYDNMQIGPDGRAMRVDAGGSLEYRAMGAKKAFGAVVGEIDSMLDPAINHYSSQVFGGLTKADMTASAKKVMSVSDEAIYELVMEHGPGDALAKKALFETLVARKEDIAKRFPKAAPKVAAVVKLDPTKLKVDASQLPKPHDFANFKGAGNPLSSKAHVNDANQAAEYALLVAATMGNLPALKDYHYDAVDKDTGAALGSKPIGEHPSSHVKAYWSDLVSTLSYIANPPAALKKFHSVLATSVTKISQAFKGAQYGITTAKADANSRLAFWIALGSAKGVEKLLPPGASLDFQSSPINGPKITPAMNQQAQSAYQGLASNRLVKRFINGIQGSGSYNDNFRDGLMITKDGMDAVGMNLDAHSYATEKPEGLEIYKWINFSGEMSKQMLDTPVGTVFQNPGSMCCSTGPTSTAGFGSDRMRIRYAKGAKAVDSYGSGNFAGEKEITTLPGQRYVILKCSKVMCPVKGQERIELDVLMLPPDPTYLSELEAMKAKNG